MKYAHRFTVKAPVEAVAEFHRHANALKAITPPPIIMQLHSVPQSLAEGDRMAFTLWMGPLPIRWEAQIEGVTASSFVDRQMSGPFGSWAHTHTFVALDAGRTEVRDEIEAEPGRGVFGRVISTLMWIGMPVLFAFRGWKTRRLLEK
jgi:ligand-binding SRPBCC domain-containing protein